MPKGGFGNLIALPLQHLPRGHGNSIFLAVDFSPHPDQWVFLSSIRRMSFAEIETLVRDAERSGEIIGVRRSVTDDDSNEALWTLPPSRKKKDPPIAGPLPTSVKITRSNLVYVEKEGLPSAVLNRLHRLAAFQNPEFYRPQGPRGPIAIDCPGRPPINRLLLPRRVCLRLLWSGRGASWIEIRNSLVSVLAFKMK
jgi:hypothetical protein